MGRQVDVKALVSHLVRGDGLDKCRICMGDTTEGQVYLGDTVMMDGERPVTLSELLEVITGVEVEMTAMLPKNVCGACFLSLQNAAPIISLSRQSNKMWQNISDALGACAPPTETVTTLFVIKNNEISCLFDLKSRPKKVKTKTDVVKYYTLLQKQKQTPRKREYKKTPLQCPQCNQSLMRKSTLRSHLECHQLRICDHCEELIQFKDTKSHIEKHGVVVYPCDFCYRIFDTEDKYKIHKRIHILGRFKCCDCTRTFTKQDSLSIHISRSHKLWICRCGETMQAQEYFNHLKTCEIKVTPNYYICDYCQMGFQTRSGIIEHIRYKHMNNTAYVCEYCGMRFSSRMKLLDHDNKHNRVEDRHVCPFCDRKYSTKRGYNLHIKYHTLPGYKRVVKRKYYPCEYCQKTFLKKGLLRHMEKVHGVVK